jgi:hypothetical protein
MMTIQEVVFVLLFAVVLMAAAEQQLDAAARASGQAAVEAEMDPTLLAK